MAVGGGLVPLVLPVVATAARKPQGERQGRGEPGRRGAGSFVIVSAIEISDKLDIFKIYLKGDKINPQILEK